MLAIIGGTSLLDYSSSQLQKIKQHTPYGSSEILRGDGFLLLMRHQNRCAPHIIPYLAHIAALKLSGADRIVAFGSTGSYRPELIPGSRIIPDDFIMVDPAPTRYNHSIGHATPVFDLEIREKLAEISPEAKFGGTYLQTTGPRLETKAEISWQSKLADVVGMTIGSEVSVSAELKIPFAAICTVDNYAHGICNSDISYDSIIEKVRENHDNSVHLLEKIIEHLR